MASETTAATNTRQNEHPYLKKTKKMYCIIHLFPHLKKFISEIVPLWLKNRNQRVDTGGGLCAEGGGAYTWSNTSVKEKVGLSAEGPIRGGLIEEKYGIIRNCSVFLEGMGLEVLHTGTSHYSDRAPDLDFKDATAPQFGHSDVVFVCVW